MIIDALKNTDTRSVRMPFGAFQDLRPSDVDQLLDETGFNLSRPVEIILLERTPEEFGALTSDATNAKAAVMHDLHDALGVKWGDDPYARIRALLEAETRLADLST